MARKQARRGARKLVDVAGYAREHPDFVQCRVWAHPWQVKGALEYRNGQVVWNLRCPRCGAEQKLQTSRRDGSVEQRKYSHADGYIWHGVGQQKPRVGELRMALADVLMKKRGGR